MSDDRTIYRCQICKKEVTGCVDGEKYDICRLCDHLDKCEYRKRKVTDRDKYHDICKKCD